MRHDKGKRRLRSAQNYHGHLAPERYSRRQVFARDGWYCGICGLKTLKSRVVPHHKAPTIDHIIPLSEGGVDCMANVRCAHFICNSKRGNRYNYDQLIMFG